MVADIKNSPTLIITVGLVGTGKTTLAKALSERLGATYLSSDVIRKRLAGIPEMEHRFVGYDKGIYSPEFSSVVYGRMLMEAIKALRDANSVVLDASFAMSERRSKARIIANIYKADFLAVECKLDENIVKERLANREDTASDGRWEIYQEQKMAFEPVVELGPGEHMVVDTAKPVGEVVGEVSEKINKERK